MIEVGDSFVYSAPPLWRDLVKIATKKQYKFKFNILFNKKFKNWFYFLSAFYLIMWLMASSKNFEKLAVLKKWQLVFFWDVKAYFGETPLKWCIFRHGKNWVSQIFSCNIDHDMYKRQFFIDKLSWFLTEVSFGTSEGN